MRSFLILLLLFPLLGNAQEYFPIKQNGKWGLINQKGALVTPPSYEAISLREKGYYRIQQQGKIGLMDQKGTVVFSPIYQDIRIIASNYFVVVKEGHRKLINSAGQVIINQDFDDAEVWNEHFIGFSHLGKWGAVDHKGQVLVNPTFERLEAWKNEFLLSSNDNGIGLINKKGHPILAPNYQAIKLHNKDLFYYKENKHWGLVNAKGEKLTDSQFLSFQAISAFKIVLFPDTSYAEKPVLFAVPQEKIISENQYDKFIQFNTEYTLTKEKTLLGLIDQNGNKILSPSYEEVHNYPSQNFRVSKDGKWGIVNRQEEIQVPIRYDFISPPNGPLAVIRQGNKYGIVNLNGEVVAPIEYDQIELNSLSAHAHKGKALSLLTFNEKGEQELENNFKNFGTIKVSQKAAKRTALPAVNAASLTDPDPYTMENFEWFQHQNQRWGLRHRYTGVIKIPPIFTQVSVRKDLGFTVVTKVQESQSTYDRTSFRHSMVAGIINNEMGMSSTQMNLLDIKMADFFGQDSLPVARVVFTNGKHGLLSRKGGIVLENYAFIGKFENGRARASQKGILTAKTKANEHHLGKLSDYLNSFITPTVLNGVTKEDRQLASEGTLQVTGGTWGYLDSLGKTAIAPVYQFVRDFKNGTAIVRTDEEWGTIDTDGNEYLPLSFDKIYFEEKANNQLLRVYNNCSRYGMIDSSGRVNVSIHFQEIRPIKEQRIAVKKGNKWGFVNQNGQKISPCIYEKVNDFSEGLAAVRYKRKWGYINTNGDLFIPHKFRRVGDFHQGLAWAAEGSYIGYINRQGETVIEAKYHRAGNFEDSLAIVRQGSNYGLINLEGTTIVKPKYNKLLSFAGEPVAIVRHVGNGTYGLIDRVGNKVSKQKFQKIEAFSNGIAIVKENNLQGLVNNKGTLILPPTYTRIEPFVNGRARFIKDGRWGFLDTNGEEIVTAQYSKCLDFNNGKAVVYFGYRNSGLINELGEYHIQPKLNRLLGFTQERGLVRQHEKRYYFVTSEGKLYKGFYEAATPFQCGAAAVKLEGRWGLINSSGIEICPPKYHKIEAFEKGYANIHINQLSGIAGLKGEILIPAEYEYIEYVGSNLFRIETDNKVGYMDTLGKWVWELGE